jgi:hypothetical protein
VRRRAPAIDPAHEPPPRLLSFSLEDWLPLVDVTEYNPDDWRDIRNWEPVGPVKFLFKDWHRDQAWHLFCRARLDWCQQYGWPGGLDYIQVMQEQVRMKRGYLHERSEGA